MIATLVKRLEQSLAYARVLQSQVEGDPSRWSDQVWEEAGKGFEYAFALAIEEAQREEMLGSGWVERELPKVRRHR